MARAVKTREGEEDGAGAGVDSGPGGPKVFPKQRYVRWGLQDAREPGASSCGIQVPHRGQG